MTKIGVLDFARETGAHAAFVERRPGHSVAKAFNAIFAQHLLENGKPAGTVGRITLAVAGDDANAKATVTCLINDIGFDSVDSGTTEDSWCQQPGSPGCCKDYDVEGVRRALSQARNERGPEWRATSSSPGTCASLRRYSKFCCGHDRPAT